VLESKLQRQIKFQTPLAAVKGGAGVASADGNAQGPNS